MSKRGRPSKRTAALEDATLDRLAEGESLRSICRDSDMPHASTVRRWVLDDPGFREQYAQARNLGLDALADEVLEIADESVDGDAPKVAAARLRFDARRWYLSKLAPKRYGDRTRLDHAGVEGAPIVDWKAAREELMRKLGLANAEQPAEPEDDQWQ